ncbi:MAG: AAA family ATPase [Bryobacteraceae bacterium]
MKLVSVRVEHFRCIRTAKIEFGGGLNVLHGPNDLGKSSLAHALRAALLLQSTATEHRDFISWYDSEGPFVELVFESEPQRIWRVRKTFGTTSSSLEWSRDGVDFAPEVRGRQVDERLSEILRWGVAPPGGKGRPKGMPMTFLTTALLAEQDRVGAIFDQALGADSDESGKKQLMSALQAMAENPLFKTVLACVQERVDEAFNISEGEAKKKRGRNSPWVKLNEEIQRKQQCSHDCEQELQKTTAIEIEIQQLRARRLELKEAATKAQEWVETLRSDFEKDQRRQEISKRLEEHQARLKVVTNELHELSEAERLHADGIQQLVALTKTRDEAQVAWNMAAEQAQKTNGELVRLQSEDRVRERQLEQSKLEVRLAVLRSEQLRHQGAIENTRAIEAAVAKVATLDNELGALANSVADLQKKREAAEGRRLEVEEQERDLRAVRSLFRWQAARNGYQQAEKGLAQLNDWRKQARDKRAAGAALESAQPSFALPLRGRLDELRRLEGDMRIAAAKLDVGLSVTLRPKRPLSVAVQRDGEQATLHDVSSSTLEASARRNLQFDIEGVAEIAVMGGAADAREEATRLDQRWAAEGEPALQKADVASIEELSRLVNDTDQRRAEIETALREAAQLEQRIADQPDWGSLLAERQRQLTATEKELTGADHSKLEKAARKLRAKDAADIETRLDALRRELDALAKDETQKESNLSAAKALVVEKQKGVDEARADRDRAQSYVLGDWQEALRQVLSQQIDVQKEIDSIEGTLKRFAAEGDESLAEAQNTVNIALEALADSEAAYRLAEERLDEANRLQLIDEGALKARREAAAKLGEKGAREALEGIEAQLRQAPAPARAISDEMLAEARRQFEEAGSQLENIDGKIREKQGALQQVGGEVAKQRAEDAASDLESATAQAHQVELEYEAWELLRKTLREAEQEEGTHLGHALAEPVAKRFAALTTGRYGKLALGPNLEMDGISIAGEDRLVELLSVGTRDQLSTIFRLTLAEQLKTAVILDDQLTQTDGSRMSWLRDLLKEIANNIQIIVFTCRPDNYLVPASGRKPTKRDAEPSPVRAVDLAQFIERWGAPSASE